MNTETRKTDGEPRPVAESDPIKAQAVLDRLLHYAQDQALALGWKTTARMIAEAAHQALIDGSSGISADKPPTLRLVKS